MEGVSDAILNFFSGSKPTSTASGAPSGGSTSMPGAAGMTDDIDMTGAAAPGAAGTIEDIDMTGAAPNPDATAILDQQQALQPEWDGLYATSSTLGVKRLQGNDAHEPENTKSQRVTGTVRTSVFLIFLYLIVDQGKRETSRVERQTRLPGTIASS